MIDFTIPDEHQALLARIRAFIAQDVRPAEAEIADPDDVLASWPSSPATRCCRR